MSTDDTTLARETQLVPLPQRKLGATFVALRPGPFCDLTTLGEDEVAAAHAPYGWVVSRLDAAGWARRDREIDRFNRALAACRTKEGQHG